MADRAYIGTELKFLIEITAGGFSMEEDDFTVEIKCGKKTKLFQKSDLITDEEGNFYVCFDTEELGTGLYEIITRASVPDDDFDDGFRTEVNKETLIRVDKL